MAWRNLWRHSRRSLLTATMMAVGVAMSMSMLTLIEGMYGTMREVVITRQLAHVQVHDADYVGKRSLYDAIGDADAAVAALDATPGVVGVAPRLMGNALVGSDTKTTGVQLFGVDPERELAVRPLDERIVDGGWLDRDGTIVLGRKLAATLEVGVGDEVVAFTQAADGSLGNELYEVVGLVSAGSPQVDRFGAFTTLDDLRTLLALPDQVHELAVVGEGDAEDVVAPLAEAVRRAIPDDLAVRPWWEVSPSTADLLAMQDVSTGVTLVFVYLIVAVGVVNTMLMSVFERTREFGLLRAVGVRPLELVRLVMLESVLLAAVSVTGGALIGGALDAWMVLVGLEVAVGGEGFEVASMQFDPVIYGKVTPASVWMPVLAVFLVAVAAAVWPAVRAARLVPVEALRTE